MNSSIFFQAAFLLNLPWIIIALCPGPAADTNSMLGIGGMVVLDDGRQPPFGSFIEIDCGEGFKKATETTSSGTFFFQITSDKRVTEFLADAERNYGREPDPFAAANSGFTTIQKGHQNAPGRCEIRAHLSGYQSSTMGVAVDGSKRIMDVGAIVLHPKIKNKKLNIDVSGLPQTDKKDAKKKQPRQEIK
jgi:hypothetical protein